MSKLLRLILLTLSLIIVVASVWFLFVPSTPEKPQNSQLAPQSMVLKFGHDMPVNSAQHVAATRFADIVNYKSNGKIKIQVFPAQELGSDQDMIQAARSGELAITLPPTSKLTFLEPSLQILDLPFLFPSRTILYAALDGLPGKMLLSKLKKNGLVCPTLWESGFKQFTANKPIRTPQDFEGLNIRIMKSPTIASQFKALGANPIPIDFHQTYSALEDNFVSGEENPLVSIVGMKFYEVQSHVIISNHAYLAQAFCFSQSILNSLSIEHQKILIETAKELTPYQRKEIIEAEKEYLQIIRDSNTEIIALTEEEREAFKKETESIIQEFKKVDAELLERVFRFLEASGAPQNTEVLVGLDADMVSGSAPSGLAIKRGIELAMDEINQRGGVLGKPMKLVVRDHSGLADRGLLNLRYFNSLNNLVAVFGGLHSPVVLAELKSIHQFEVPFLVPWAAATPIVSNNQSPNYVFRVSVRDEYAGEFLVNEALKNYTKIGLLLENTGWGRSNNKAMTVALEKRGLVPELQWFNWGVMDFSPYIENLEAKGAEVILFVGNAPEGIHLVKTLAKRTQQIPVISHWGITGGYFWKEVGRELGQINLTFLQSYSFLKELTPRAIQLVDQYKSKYNIQSPEEIIAPVGTAHAYDLTQMLAMAIEQADSLDRSAIQQALESLPRYEGVVKTYDPPFTRERHDALDGNIFFLARYNQSGNIVPVDLEK